MELKVQDFGKAHLAQCTYCGDKQIQTLAGEVCDDGNNYNTDSCVNCKPADCGDGFIQTGIETCDGAPGCRSPNAKAECTSCGDGVRQIDSTPSEECDLGASNSNTNSNACRIGCINPRCGDGIRDSGENCDGRDFGTADNIQILGKVCRLAGTNGQCTYCGDNQKNADEACDGSDFGPSGKPHAKATCSALCTINRYCQDGIKNGGEFCDGNDFGPAGKPHPNATCSAQCTIAPYCQDGIKNGTEVCDGNDFGAEGKPNDTVTCTSQCTFSPYCGDGIVGNTVGEECDRGNANGVGSSCSSSCKNLVCDYTLSHLASAAAHGEKLFGGDIPKCLNNLISSCASAVASDMRYDNDFTALGVKHLAECTFKNNCGDAGWMGYMDDEKYTTEDCVFDRIRAAFGGSMAWATAGVWGYYSVDANGNCYFDTGSPDNLCGTTTVKYGTSPISLLWEENSYIDKDYSIVNFPINPNQDSKVFTWKASGSAPLLVYDPEQSGLITSPTQLFGNWTFGGREVGIAKISHNSVTSEIIWNDGYEALKVLDKDNNAILSDSELDSLSLWFDYNKNGVSDAGEVQTLKAMNVTKIYTDSDYKDEKTGDLHARVGYERVVNGVVIKGGSVDWYSSEYSSTAEAIINLQRDGIKASPSDSKVDSKPYLVVAAEIKEKVSPKTNLTGIWKWSVDDKESAVITHDAYFVIEDSNSDNEDFRGISLREDRVFPSSPKLEKGKERELSSIASFTSLLGSKKIKNGGISELTFVAKASEGREVKNVVKVSADGLRMKGRSSVVIISEGEKETTLEYDWTANRLSYK